MDWAAVIAIVGVIAAALIGWDILDYYGRQGVRDIWDDVKKLFRGRRGKRKGRHSE